jgi:hypothetical protein
VARDLFPDGLSGWGLAMLLDETRPISLTLESVFERQLCAIDNGVYQCGQPAADALRASKDRMVEVILELVRRATCPDKPGRLQGVFAYRTQEGAELFRDAFGQPGDSIWRLAAEGDVHDADARLQASPKHP